MTASYSASLLEAWKLNPRVYSVSIPFGEVRISPTPLPWALTGPSMDNLQIGRSGASWGSLHGLCWSEFHDEICQDPPFYNCPQFVPDVEFTQLYSPLYQPSRGFWFMQYLLHRIFNWDFNGISLEVRSEFSGLSYQCQDQLFHLWAPLLRSPQSSAIIVDWLLYLISFSYQDGTSGKA